MAEVNWQLFNYLVHLRDMDDRAILCECLNSREGKGGEVWRGAWSRVGAAAAEVLVVARGARAGDVEQVRQVGQAPVAGPQLTPALPDHPLIRSIQSN